MDTLRHLQVWVASFWSFGAESASASRCGRGRGNRHGVFPGKNVFCSEGTKNSNPKRWFVFFFKLLLKFGRLRKLFNDYVSHVSVFPNSWTISFTIRSACALPPSAALEPGLLLKISNRSCMGLHRMSYMHGCFLSCFTILTVSQLPPTMDQYLWRSGFLPMLVQRHEHESSGSLTETRMIWTDFNCNCNITNI